VHSGEDLSLYKGLYDAEWSRRAEIHQAAGIPIGVLTLLAGAIVFLERDYMPTHTWLDLAFASALILASLGFLISAFMLVRCLFGWRYRRIPWPSQVRKYHEEWNAYKQARPEVDGTPREALNGLLIECYIDAADINSVNNVNSGEYLFKANRALIVALIFFALAIIPVVVAPASIKVVSGRPLMEVNVVNSSNSSDKPKTQAEPQQSQPPVKPKNIDIRTGTELPPKKGQ
jgi:hypothetical protein